MICLALRCALTWSLVLVFVSPGLGSSAVISAAIQDDPPASVTLRWGARAGVSRYRLQLANDARFTDIIFDRVVSGHEYRLGDLRPGRYFWRVASLNAERGEFSSAGVIEVPAMGESKPPSRRAGDSSTTTITSRGGWYAAIGNVANSIIARLRSPNSSEIVSVTTDGRVVALDAISGVALWTSSSRVNAQATGLVSLPVAVRAPDGTDDVLLLVARIALLLDGQSGRELWRTTLPSMATVAAASGPTVFVIDNSLRKLLVIDTKAGKLISEIALPRRAVGPPAVINYQRAFAVITALDDGGIHVFDNSGKLIASASSGSPATTAPLLVRTARGELVLVGTRSGLTAMTADELRPLGRVTINGDAPRGILTGRDLDGDGRAEVVMLTERGRLVVIKSDEGRILWEADVQFVESPAFADLNSDGLLDLLMLSSDGSAFALSGRDGAIIWKEDDKGGAPKQSHWARTSFVVPLTSSVLFITSDLKRGGLRAIEFPKR